MNKYSVQFEVIVEAQDPEAATEKAAAALHEIYVFDPEELTDMATSVEEL